MDVLSPAKLLVILVVAIVVLGPDKLPKVARQVGGLWADFRAFRHRLESGVRESFPDLPSTEVIAQAVRSPLAFLDNLADTHAADSAGTSAATGPETTAVGGDAVQPATGSNRPAGSVRTDGDPGTAAGTTVTTSGARHQIRGTEYPVPDDPGLN